MNSKRTNDILVFKTANEIYLEVENNIGIKDYSIELDRQIRKTNSEICNHILKSIKRGKKKTFHMIL